MKLNRSLALLPLIFLGLGCMDNTLKPIQDDPSDGKPEIMVSPEVVNFGVVPEGESVGSILTLASVGTQTLNITAMQVGDGRWAFSLLEPVVGSFEPDTATEFTVVYNSLGTAAEGMLEILSNDPDHPNLSVPLLAEAVDTPDTGDTADTGVPLSQPVAVCSVDPAEVLAIHESADWIGSTSYDPDGTIVDYSWILYSSPAGATTAMPGGTANRRGFTPDVAGEYVGELTVTDNDGLTSEPCYATLNATAGDGLWVELFWTNSGDDMDLHLLDDGGTLTTTSDCYYANCTWGSLNWGGGGTSDDPILDLDDIPGTGPENINIDSPARGTYTVYVHDYPGSQYIGRNDVTVNVYLGGSLIWTDTRNINSENCYEPFVEVSVPSGSTTTAAGGCR